MNTGFCGYLSLQILQFAFATGIDFGWDDNSPDAFLCIFVMGGSREVSSINSPEQKKIYPQLLNLSSSLHLSALVP